MTGPRKTKAYYKDLASKNARAARTSQMKLKVYKEGIQEGLRIARDARNQ